MNIHEQAPSQGPSNIANLLKPIYASDSDPAADVASDEANLIVDVYTNLGLMGKEAAEAAPERITAGILSLRETYPDKMLETFVIVQLEDIAAFGKLVTRFAEVYKGALPDSYSNEMWKEYSIDSINIRRTNKTMGPKAGDVRGHDLSMVGDSNMPGFIDSGKSSIIEMRRKFAGDTLLNIADWILLEAMRRTAGMPSLLGYYAIKPADTRFPQMPYDTYISQDSRTRLKFNNSKVTDIPRSRYLGVRRSLGLADNS